MAHSIFLLKSFLLLLLTYCVCGKKFLTHRLGDINRLNRAAVVNGQSLEKYEVYNYTQTLDHFNFNSESYTTFQQRYVVMHKYWGGSANSSPIFVYFGDQTDIMRDIEFLGFPMILAKRFSALLVCLEHRYYGTSMPFGTQEEAYKNSSTLGFFSIEQALADYAHIIVDVKKNISAENCPVIVLGGFYAGMLASWFRLKYPHIAYGAYASSAPILYLSGLTPENGYTSVISKNLNSTSASCYKTIRESWFEMDRVVAQPNGLSNLSHMFNTCVPLNTSEDLKVNLAARYGNWAQYDSPNIFQQYCNAIDGLGEKAYVLDKIIAGLVAVRGPRCFFVRDFTFNKTYGWDWQSCTEWVVPLGHGENDTVFQANPFDLEEYTKECQQVFGVIPRPYWIPIEFGGHGIKTVLKMFASNIIFTNGLRDPYSPGGVLQSISETIVAVTTEEGHHCFDILTPTDSDPDWVVAQRETVINVIKGWLSRYIVPDSSNS